MNERENRTKRNPMLEASERDSQKEARQRDESRIYVASLSDYNNGILHGRWIDATEDVEEMWTHVTEMLRSSPTALRFGQVAEEWAIHDYEGFGDLRLGEYEPLSKIAMLAGGIQKHGLAFSAWVAHVGEQSADLIEQFEDRFQGRWESREAYSEDMLDELGANRFLDEAPQWLQGYLTLDVAGFARDLELGGDIVAIEANDEEGGVWVLSGH